jgi:putative oxidoreductase
MLQDLGLLFLRVSTGALMIAGHGWPKLMKFGELSETFRDPIGLGPLTSLVLAIFAELFCSIAVIVGFKTRLAAIPLVTTMLVVTLIVHWEDPWNKKEFALLYAVPFISLIIMGSGRFSIDRMLRKE